MATRIVARCPGCRRTFPWEPKNGLPSKCPLPGCDYEAKEIDDTVISMPALRSFRMKATDDVYRQTEKASEVRAQMAADAAGVSVSEMSGLKITNMRDNAKYGESSVVPVVNEVTRQMDLIRARGGHAGFTTGAEHAKAAQAAAPRSGINAMTAVQQLMGRR